MKDLLNLTAAYLSSRTSEKNPNKFGIKVWKLADFKTCFVSRFQVYLGKQETDNKPAMMTDTVDKTEINVSYGKTSVSSYDSFPNVDY